jgi:competence protein ComEC
MRMSTLIAGLLVLLSCSAFAAPRGLDIYFVDVEGGAATLIVTPAGESVLIDCGSPGERDAARINKAARDAGLTAIDHFIATHWHSDHYGGTPDVVKLIPIRSFYHRGIPDTLPEDRAFPQMIAAYKKAMGGNGVILKPGATVPLKQVPDAPTLRLLTLCGSEQFIPDRPNARRNPIAADFKPQAPDPSDNAKSLGFVLSFGGFRFLDLGDLTWNMEQKLIDPTDKIGPIDVYQTTHHGLEVSNNPTLIKTVNPRVAVFNNGPRKGGHPDVTRTLRSLPDIQAIYQLHRNVTAGPELNTRPENIANTEEQCAGEYVKLSVAPDGRSYTVTVGSKGTPKRFDTRMK